MSEPIGPENIIVANSRLTLPNVLRIKVMTKIYVAGHSGMVGSAIVRLLQKRKQKGEPIELITRTHAELDLTEQSAVRDFFSEAKPDVVILFPV